MIQGMQDYEHLLLEFRLYEARIRAKLVILHIQDATGKAYSDITSDDIREYVRKSERSK